MPVARPAYFWEADCQLDVKDIAFTVGRKETKEGNRVVQLFEMENLKDGTILWNPAQRLKGWLKQQCGTLRASSRELIQYGVKVHNAQGGEWIPIAEPGNLVGLDKNPDSAYEYRCPDGFKQYPFLDRIKVHEGGRITSRYAFWYLLPGPITVNYKIYCFARNITPDSIEDLLKKLGPIAGLGDRHSSGVNGLFELKRWKSKQETLSF
jgi:hypothetical protein